MLTDGAHLIQQLEGSRPHGELCTLSGVDRVQRFTEAAVMSVNWYFGDRMGAAGQATGDA